MGGFFFSGYINKQTCTHHNLNVAVNLQFFQYLVPLDVWLCKIIVGKFAESPSWHDLKIP